MVMLVMRMGVRMVMMVGRVMVGRMVPVMGMMV
jgi:hypothetical protein